jgi:hypothetical protein
VGSPDLLRGLEGRSGRCWWPMVGMRAGEGGSFYGAHATATVEQWRSLEPGGAAGEQRSEAGDALDL